ncbi:hypothetical protein AGMMS49525_00190 [Bacteroidia bacterium]|nr:hypothetical protein AGMMS49525_00190 [Bacteroidia bacterium]
MRYLIDTNMSIYMTEDQKFLAKNVLHLLEDNSNLLFMSSESVNELIHLFQTGKIGSRTWKNAQDIIYFY